VGGGYLISVPNDIRITLGAVSCSRSEIVMSQNRTVVQGRVGREAGHDENCRAKFSTPWMYINTQSTRLRREESANRIKNMSVARNGGIEKKCLVRKSAPAYMYMTLL